MTKKILLLFLTLFNLGHLTPFPGTLASIVTMLFLFLIGYLFPINLMVYFLFLLAGGALGIYSCNLAFKRKYFSNSDPQFVVFDEFLGCAIACWPIISDVSLEFRSFFMFGVALISFRIFDISKWGIIKKMEKYPQGWGIMLDDMMAGFFSWLIVIPLDLVYVFFFFQQ